MVEGLEGCLDQQSNVFKKMYSVFTDVVRCRHSGDLLCFCAAPAHSEAPISSAASSNKVGPLMHDPPIFEGLNMGYHVENAGYGTGMDGI